MKGSEAVCCLKNSVTLGGRVTICSLLGVFQIDCAPSIADCGSHTAADIQMTNSYYMSDFNKYEKCLLANVIAQDVRVIASLARIVREQHRYRCVEDCQGC